MPLPRLATIDAASFDTATPTARKPWWRSLSRAGAVRLDESFELSCSGFIVLTSSIQTDASSLRGAPDSAALLAWYDRHRRILPWRAPPGIRPDPYRVWLSEIMLQQTTVATVEPYFDRFVARWPDISALAAASLDEVLQLWQGLGYYARARNLHACARTVVERHGGAFPEEAKALRALPGIGDYTAAAIAAIAFDRRGAAIDGNVERVVARLYAVSDPLPAAKVRLRALAATMVPDRRAGDFAQALMDLGATICTPRRPRCVLCPWRPCCAAAASGRAEDLPARGEKPERPLRHGVAFWLTRGDGAVLLRRRPEKGLLGGMTEIPSTPWRDTPWSFAEALRAAPAAAVWSPLHGIVRHGFTHFLLELAVVAGTGVAEGIWSPVERLGDHALPTLMKKVARHAISALAAGPYGGPNANAANSGRSPSAASRTGANESR
jgi:A/G-specific adenine glycosylase